jgi:hypothetical protein
MSYDEFEWGKKMTENKDSEIKLKYESIKGMDFNDLTSEVIYKIPSDIDELFFETGSLSEVLLAQTVLTNHKAELTNQNYKDNELSASEESLLAVECAKQVKDLCSAYNKNLNIIIEKSSLLEDRVDFDFSHSMSKALDDIKAFFLDDENAHCDQDGNSKNDDSVQCEIVMDAPMLQGQPSRAELEQEVETMREFQSQREIQLQKDLEDLMYGGQRSTVEDFQSHYGSKRAIGDMLGSNVIDFGRYYRAKQRAQMFTR